jgi:hypothetical protein
MKRTSKRAPRRAPLSKEITMSAAAGQPNLHRVLLDPRKPPETRARILLDVLQDSSEPVVQQAVLTQLLQQAGAATPEAEALRLKESYEHALAELENGAVRPATFLAEAGGNLPGPGPRAHVISPDGQERFPTLHPRVTLPELKPGMTVYLDPRGAVLLGIAPVAPPAGQQATFLRRVAETGQVEVSLRDERLLLHAAEPIRQAAAAGRLHAGDRLLVCPRRLFALALVPPETHCRRFVDASRTPDVVAARDIGRPHAILDTLVRRLRLLLFRPDLLARFELRPSFAALLTGPSGCGKTLTLRAFQHEFARLVAERTGRRDLGSRVIRVKTAELLSEWLGRSDKNVEELFDDIQSVAGTEVATASGQRLRLPVIVILEEVEGLARRRGSQDGAVYDRILATLLQRFDDLGDLPLFLLSTSNRPDLIDAAVARRLGVQARFGRLDRDGLAAVLDKKLKPEYPYAAARAAVTDHVVGRLFGPGGDKQGVVEVTLHDGRTLLKHRRDFLTGGLVEQAVATAIDQTVSAAEAGTGEGRLDGVTVAEALERQIDSLAEVLTPDNTADYLDLPEGARVTGVRRLRGAGGYHLTSLTLDLDN